MYVNHSINYLFSSLKDSINNYPIYIFIIISSIILLILLLNKSYFIKRIVFFINIIVTIIIIINYNYHLFSIDTFSHFIHNIYFYFLSSIIFMIINTIMLFKNEYYKINIVFYVIHLIFILFSLFMTYYLSCNYFLILFNIYSEIVLGNVLYILYYIFCIVISFCKKL